MSETCDGGERVGIRTGSLSLVPLSIEATHAKVAAMSPADRAQVSDQWLAQLRALTAPDPWVLGFALVLRETGVAVGSAGFTGPPGADGIVEVAYSVDPEHRGKGFATEAAKALTAWAFDDRRVRIVCAHTLPEPNASTRVLAKCGFRHLGPIEHPEDGLVWRWEKHRGDG